MKIPKRIALVGGSGAGKTTLGKALAKCIQGVFIEVDAIQHKAGWEKASDNEIHAAIQIAFDGNERWVIDGICEREVGDLVSSQADVIVWLDLPLCVKLVRLFRRSYKRVRTGEELWNGNVEMWRNVFWGRDAVLMYPLRTHFRQRRRMLGRTDLENVVRLRSTRAVNKWLSKIQDISDA